VTEQRSVARGWHPASAFEQIAQPVPRIVEHHASPRPWSASWFDPPFLPDPRLVDQVYGICFDDTGSILLVCSYEGPDRRPYWNLPGGGLEDGETFEQCLVREVAEEGCVDVIDAQYLGCQRVDELSDGKVERGCYQLRFWARVRLCEWAPAHETVERRLVPADEFRSTLEWGDAATAQIILEQGLQVDRSR
jgi:8-oxo-dGTP diphosphatase